MGIRRTISGMFMTCAIALALVSMNPGSTRPLMAQASVCGGYGGPLCSATESCVYYLVYKICTTKYSYYPKIKEGGGGDPGELEEGPS